MHTKNIDNVQFYCKHLNESSVERKNHATCRNIESLRKGLKVNPPSLCVNGELKSLQFNTENDIFEEK